MTYKCVNIIKMRNAIRIIMKRIKLQNMQQEKVPAYHQKYFTLIYEHNSWEQSIKPIIEQISTRAFNSAQLIEKLRLFHFFTQTHRKVGGRHQKNQYNFNELLFYEKQLPDLFANMANLILSYDKNYPKYPVMYSGIPMSHTYTKKQILLLMSMMSLSLLPEQQFQFKFKFPFSNDFKWIFSQDPFKTQSIISYLRMQFQNYSKLGPAYPKQKLTLRRLVKKQTIEEAIKKNFNKPMMMPIIVENNDSIEDYYGDVKIDFANKFIGGGAFHSGCVQEEIMFVNHPEMYTSALFCQVMRENQAIQFVGYKKYFKNKGYGWTAQFDGLEENAKYQYDQENRAKEYISAIDAIHFPNERHPMQFSPDIINRQLFKAFVGFDESGTKQNRIISGNWGCGAFNGTIELKFFIQWLASSMASKQLVYVPFGAKNKISKQKINNRVGKMRVGEFYSLLMNSSDQLKKTRDIYKVLEHQLQIENSKKEG